MMYSLPPFASIQPSGAPDLRLELRQRRNSRRDLRVDAARVRFVRGGSRTVLRCDGRDYDLSDAARPGSAREAARRNEWIESSRELLLRFEGETVRAVLPGEARVLDTLELLDRTVDAFRRVPVEVKIEHCVEEDGELYLTAVAPSLAGALQEGDYLYGGFYLAHSETTLQDTEASVRIYRVACRNGALVDAQEGQRLVLPRLVRAGEPDPTAAWAERLDRVVARSFDGGDLDTETARFRALISQVLATPYEMLLHLEAQGLISAEDRERIQRDFNEGRDDSMFALVNAVTFQAHALRDSNDWARAFAIERLGGEILRGDHQPPVLEPVPV